MVGVEQVDAGGDGGGEGGGSGVAWVRRVEAWEVCGWGWGVWGVVVEGAATNEIYTRKLVGGVRGV